MVGCILAAVVTCWCKFFLYIFDLVKLNMTATSLLLSPVIIIILSDKPLLLILNSPIIVLNPSHKKPTLNFMGLWFYDHRKRVVLVVRPQMQIMW